MIALDRPVTIADLARMASATSGQRVPTRQMRRMLFDAQKRNPHVDFLYRAGGEDPAGGRWHVRSVAKLREAWPDFGKSFPGPDDVAKLKKRITELETAARNDRARIGKLERIVKGLLLVAEERAGFSDERPSGVVRVGDALAAAGRTRSA